jgi:hypothetical protein
MAARYIDNNDGTFTLIGDNGQKQSFLDPDGSYRKELDSISTASGEIAGASGDATSRGFAPMGNAPAGLAGNPAMQAPPAPVGRGYIPPAASYVPAAPVAPEPPMPNAQELPPMGEGMPELPTATGPAPAPPMRITMPGSPAKTQTTLSITAPQTTSTSGSSVEERDPNGTIAAAQSGAVDAQRSANEALEAGKSKALENSGRLIENETLRAYTENAAQTTIANQKEVAMNQALADRKAARAVPIDPSLAFAGDDGAAAMAATIGMAISNVGLAWMGQAAQPINIIDHLVDRSVAIQTAQKQQNVESASESVEMNRAQAAEARANARVSLAQQLDSQRAYVQNENETGMLDSLAKDNEAKLKQSEVEYAQAVADHVVKNNSTTHTSGGATQSTVTKGGEPDTVIEIPAGSDQEQAADAVNAARFDVEAKPDERKSLEKLAENVAYTNDREKTIAELERLEKASGAVSDVVGVWQSGKGALASMLPGVAKENLRSPDQNRAADLLAKLEGLNRQSWKTEPNNVKTQEKLATLGLPKNDSDLSTFFAKQKEAVLQMRNEDYKGYDNKVVGKFRTQNRKTRPATGVEEF